MAHSVLKTIVLQEQSAPVGGGAGEREGLPKPEKKISCSFLPYTMVLALLVGHSVFTAHTCQQTSKGEPQDPLAGDCRCQGDPRLHQIHESESKAPGAANHDRSNRGLYWVRELLVLHLAKPS